MSGKTITIVAVDDSDVVRFIDAIARLPNDLPEWVLIGGVAVVLRVGGTHRVTVDIDTLARESNRLVSRSSLASSLADHVRNGDRYLAAHC